MTNADKKSQSTEPLPEVSTVTGWLRKDLEAAHYLLGYVLLNAPEIIEKMGAEMHLHASSRPGPEPMRADHDK